MCFLHAMAAEVQGRFSALRCSKAYIVTYCSYVSRKIFIWTRKEGLKKANPVAHR